MHFKLIGVITMLEAFGYFGRIVQRDIKTKFLLCKEILFKTLQDVKKAWVKATVEWKLLTFCIMDRGGTLCPLLWGYIVEGCLLLTPRWGKGRWKWSELFPQFKWHIDLSMKGRLLRQGLWFFNLGTNFRGKVYHDVPWSHFWKDVCQMESVRGPGLMDTIIS